MDQPDVNPQSHQLALAGLRRVNAVSRSDALLWPAIRDLAKELHPTPLRLLDLGSGGGDVAIGLARRAARAGLNLQLDGCDISPVAIELAQQRARQAGLRSLRFFRLDVRNDPFPRDYSVIMCSLFLHHWSDADAGQLLAKMAEAAGQLVLVNDLRRCRVGYGVAVLACRALTRSPIVHFDGPTSVANAFTQAELQQLATSNGLTGAIVTRHWPFRLLLTWRRYG